MYPQTQYQAMIPQQPNSLPYPQQGYSDQGYAMPSQQHVQYNAPTTSQPQSTRPKVAETAANKAGAYGGSEIGSKVGGMVGPPIIGGIAGNIIGEKLGEKAVQNTGITRRVGQARDDLADVIGEKQVDKLGEITLVALGYSEDETCVCCPCMPRSQIMFFVMVAFSIFTWYRLGTGSSWENSCQKGLENVTIQWVNATIPSDTGNYSYVYSPTADNRTALVEYPCSFGFDYMVTGATVWAIFLPFHIFTLLGNCWRQCCCCLCDPLVCCSCICDLIKRYCCECGRFSVIAFVWYSMCIFQVGWGLAGLHWIVKEVFFMDGTPESKLTSLPTYVTFLEVTLASVVLDLTLAGSELVHKARSYFSDGQSSPGRVQPQSHYEMKPAE